MPLNLQSLSITSAFNSILNFFKSQENSSSWKDLSGSSEGVFLVRLLSNVFSNISYRVVSQSRENYLSTAALTSSTTGIAVNLGYSVFRGSNLKRLINITPLSDMRISKLNAIGKYSPDYDIICLDDVTLTAGNPKDVRVVIGKVKEIIFNADTSDVKIFSRFETGISEDFVLKVNNVEVPTTKIIKEMINDKYLVRTNPYSSVDILYLNNYKGAQYTYSEGSEFILSYVELADIAAIPFTDDMFTYGTLNDTKNISTYLPFESVEETKVYAPLGHETQNLIRSKQDYANRLQQEVHALSQATYEPLTPTYTLLSYLKNDFTLLTDTEKESVLEVLKEENFFGTPLPDITVPRREVANLKIQMKLNTKYKDIVNINLDVQNILDNHYSAKLGSTFNTFDLERRIEGLSYVKYARVSHVINDRNSDTNYQIGYILSKDGQYYIAGKILGLSGATPPNWNLPLIAPSTIDTGLETLDGSIVWRTFKYLPNMDKTTFIERQNNMQYGVGDYVYDEVNAPNYMFKCVDIKKSSGYSVPNATSAVTGDFIVDGSIVWVAKDRSETYPTWESNKSYSLGNSVNIPSSASVSFECVSYTGTTGTEENLSFELPIYDVIHQSEDAFVVEGNKVYYFRPNDVIYATFAGGSKTFVVLESTYDGTNTTVKTTMPLDLNIKFEKIYTVGRGTRDGQILWTIVEDIENIQYPWNSYTVFDYEIEILE